MFLQNLSSSWLSRALFFSMSFGVNTPAFAQTSGPLFSGTFQYIMGDAKLKQRSKKQIEPEFKDLLLVNEEVTTASDSLVKIVTRARCKLVLYQRSEVKAVKVKTGNYGFRLKRGATRVICDDNAIAEQLIRIKGNNFVLKNGEFLFADGKVFVLKGSVKVDNQVLPSQKIYALKDKNWVIAVDPNEKLIAYEFNELYPPPSEGTKIEKPLPPEPPQPATPPEEIAKDEVKKVQSRWTAAIGIGNSNIGYAAGAETADVDASSLRLNANFKMWDISFNAYFEHFTIETSKNDSGDPSGITTDLLEKNDINGFGLGVRYNHDRWWSFYTNVGLGFHEMFVEFRNPTFIGGQIEQTAIHVQLGIESHLTATLDWLDWTGLYLGFEVFLLQGIATDGDPFQEITFPTEEFTSREGTWRNFGFKIMLGTYLQFFED